MPNDLHSGTWACREGYQEHIESVRTVSHPRGSSGKLLAFEMRVPGQKSQVTSPRTQFRSSHCWRDVARVMPHVVCDVNCVRWRQDRPRHIRQAGFMFQDHACHSILTNSKKGGYCLFIKKNEVLGLFGHNVLEFRACGRRSPCGFPVINQLRALGVDFVTADKRPFGLWRFWSFFKKPDGF